MKLRYFFAILLFCGSAPAQLASQRTMAVTIDDLPYVTIDAPYLPNAQRATKAILRVLQKHKAPMVVFVNEAKLQEEREARTALLKQWVDSGAILGNRFVTLDEVMKDPAYQTKDNWVGKTGPTWLFRWAKSKGLNLSFAADPDPPQWVMDLYNQR